MPKRPSVVNALAGFSSCVLTMWVAVISPDDVAYPAGFSAAGVTALLMYWLTKRIEHRSLARVSALSSRELAKEEKIENLREQCNQQEAIIACMVEAVVAFDQRERIIRINRAAENLLHITPDTAVGKSIQEVLKSSALQKIAQQILAQPESFETEITLYGNEETIVRVFASALRNSTGACFGGLLVLDDVSHVRKLEEIRRDFVANVSHELRTPITSIKGFVETLLDGALEKPEDATRFLGIVAKQADRLNEIFNDLLLLARVEQTGETSGLTFESVELQNIIQSAITNLEERRAGKNMTIEVICPHNLRADIHPSLMEQALGNLIANAITHSEPGKHITVEGTLLPNTDEVRVAVQDHGCGIAREHLPRIFERFYRVDKARSRKHGGTGLGLSIVKHITQAHRGRLDVQSTLGKGSTFCIIFPRNQQQDGEILPNFN